MDQYSNTIHELDRSKNIQTTNKEARLYIDENWKTLEQKLKLINAKKLLSFIIQHMKDNYNISLTKNKILNKFEISDIDNEIKEVINLIIF